MVKPSRPRCDRDASSLTDEVGKRRGARATVADRNGRDPKKALTNDVAQCDDPPRRRRATREFRSFRATILAGEVLDDASAPFDRSQFRQDLRRERTMLSRRDLIGKAAIGAAAALTVSAVGTGVAVASTQTLEDTTGDRGDAHALEPRTDAAVTAAPPPWALVSPFGAGAVVAHDWRLVDLSPVRDGSTVATLRNAGGRAHRVHLCRNDGSPHGIVYTRRVDLVVMNQGDGALPTEEHFGQAVAALAHAVAANETTVTDDVLAGLTPHAERLERFAMAEGPLADGKLR
jgi:hypothetical protein